MTVLRRRSGYVQPAGPTTTGTRSLTPKRPTSAHKRKVLPVTLETLHFLRGLCDQVRVDQPLGCVKARNTVETLWKAVDELDAAMVETEKFTSSAL